MAKRKRPPEPDVIETGIAAEEGAGEAVGVTEEQPIAVMAELGAVETPVKREPTGVELPNGITVKHW